MIMIFLKIQNNYSYFKSSGKNYDSDERIHQWLSFDEEDGRLQLEETF